MVGTVTISMEVELGWGVHDRTTPPDAHLSETGEQERFYLSRLLTWCDEYEIPISFDVTGHLGLDSCAGTHDGPHSPGWFDADPGTNVTEDPLFYAPDAVQEIVDASTQHELCSHTFSHILCDEADPETVAWELQESQRMIRDYTGSNTVSLVPPRHSPPPTDPLRENGIEIVRMGVDTSTSSRTERLIELLYGPHPVFEPIIANDVVYTYCTTYSSLVSPALPAGQRAPNLPFSLLPNRVARRLHRGYLTRAVDAAVEAEGCCHLWCHLYDLANEHQWPIIRDFLGELATRRENGEIRILPMAALNEQVRSNMEPQSRETSSEIPSKPTRC